MKKILCRIKCDWDDLANKPELVILKKYACISRICTIVMGGKCSDMKIWLKLITKF